MAILTTTCATSATRTTDPATRPTGARPAAARPAAPSPAPAGELYVVATHKVRERSARGPQSWVPYGRQHAWQAGTRSTLCGQFIAGWTVFWERPFAARSGEACPDCVEATLPAAARARLAPRQAEPHSLAG